MNTQDVRTRRTNAVAAVPNTSVQTAASATIASAPAQEDRQRCSLTEDIVKEGRSKSAARAVCCQPIADALCARWLARRLPCLGVAAPPLSRKSTASLHWRLPAARPVCVGLPTALHPRTDTANQQQWLSTAGPARRALARRPQPQPSATCSARCARWAARARFLVATSPYPTGARLPSAAMRLRRARPALPSLPAKTRVWLLCKLAVPCLCLAVRRRAGCTTGLSYFDLSYAVHTCAACMCLHLYECAPSLYCTDHFSFMLAMQVRTLVPPSRPPCPCQPTAAACAPLPCGTCRGRASASRRHAKYWRCRRRRRACPKGVLDRGTGARCVVARSCG